MAVMAVLPVTAGLDSAARSLEPGAWTAGKFGQSLGRDNWSRSAVFKLEVRIMALETSK